jgi:CRISPR/Cas system-associated exonuclease Cas4 (RecB family)
MNIEKHVQLKTVHAIYEWHKSKRKNEHRPHLGGSQIGRECSRALWYQFRHAWSPNFDGRMLRLFETGDLEEERFERELRGIGAKVWAKDPETGKQIRFEVCGGHFALSLDGVVENIPDAPSKPHTLEMKTANEKSFAKMKKNGLQVANPVYWAQCQVGMHLSKIHDCLFLMKNKNTDEIYGERIKYDAAEGMQLIAKAESIVFSDTPPPRLSEEPSDWRCKFCPYWAVCHGCKIPEANCRTCAHSTPERDGTWSCAKGHDFGEICQDHLFNPDIMPKAWEVLDSRMGWVEYSDEDGEVIRNFQNSEDLHKSRMKGPDDVAI